MEAGDQAREQASLRISELRQRALEITERNRELAGLEPGIGSSPDDVRAAAERAERAQVNAEAAQSRAALACLRSAAAHDAAARRHEALAAGGFTDPDEHRRQARWHREMAAADRRIAGEV